MTEKDKTVKSRPSEKDAKRHPAEKDRPLRIEDIYSRYCSRCGGVADPGKDERPCKCA